MAQIYTRKFVQARFEMAFKSLGLPTGETMVKNDAGEWKPVDGVYFLDYAPIYGGYNIRRTGDRGQESTPFGSARYSGAVMCHMLGAMVDLDFIRLQRARDGKKPGER